MKCDSIQRVSTDDYEAIYINKELYDTGHSIDSQIYENILRELGIEITTKYIPHKELLEHFDEQFPDNYNEIEEYENINSKR